MWLQGSWRSSAMADLWTNKGDYSTTLLGGNRAFATPRNRKPNSGRPQGHYWIQPFHLPQFQQVTQLNVLSNVRKHKGGRAVRVEWRARNMTVTQESRPRIPFQTKRHETFPKPNLEGLCLNGTNMFLRDTKGDLVHLGEMWRLHVKVLLCNHLGWEQFEFLEEVIDCVGYSILLSTVLWLQEL